MDDTARQDETVMVVVRGIPKPQPRPRFVGKGRVVSTADKATKLWAERVRGAVRQVMADRHGTSWKGYAGAVQVDVTFVMPIGDSKRFGDFALCRADLDNFVKLIWDAMQKAGVFAAGDHQVVCSSLVKVYGPEAQCGVCITISPPRVTDTVSGRLALIAGIPDVDRPGWLA